MPRLWLLALALCTVSALSGCSTRRVLRVSSEPVGATVEIDGRVVGTTPIDVDFQHYGTRQFTLTRKGYEVWTKEQEIAPPWYGRFPLDLITEVLIPIGYTDVHEVRAELKPQSAGIKAPDLRGVLMRARALRQVARPQASNANRGPDDEPENSSTPTPAESPVDEG